MTENSMFFSNGAWYTQVQFARFLKDIFSDGVCDGIDNELEVIANTPANMAVQVKTGRSYVQGYIHEILTDPVQLAIEAADPTNPRIDRIVLHLDVNSARSVIVKVLKGTASASPVAPTLTQTSSIWEISLAQVYVAANTTVINSGNITDERTYMWYTRDNQPKASTTEYGAVKVGSGLDIANGVLSLGAINNILIEHASTSLASGGFRIGRYQYNIPSASSGSIRMGSADYTTMCNLVIGAITKHEYPPFKFTYGESLSRSVTFTCSYASTRGYMWSASYSFRAVRAKDNSILASQVKSMYESTAMTASITLTFNLPADWEFGVETLRFEAYMTNTGATVDASVSIASSTVSQEIYYYPME